MLLENAKGAQDDRGGFSREADGDIKMDVREMLARAAACRTRKLLTVVRAGFIPAPQRGGRDARFCVSLRNTPVHWPWRQM